MYGLYSRAAYDGARTVFKNVLKVSNFEKALKCRPAALIYVFTCVTVGSVMVFDKNLIWFFVSCLSPIFMKQKCHFYRPF